MYDIILFDLDGTLTDPGIGITNSVAHALAHWNIEVKDRAELYKFIGPPLSDSFMRYYGFSEEDAIQAIAVYREYFSVKGLYENEVYPGIPELLSALKAAGKTVVLATSKPEALSIEILNHFGLSPYFEIIAGAGMDGVRDKKSEVIAYLLEQIHCYDGIVMVGDTKFDILGAAAHNIPAVGVSWGYGLREDMEAAGAAAIANTMDELYTILHTL